MPFFKFRRGDASSAPPAGSAAQVESVEVLRRRARHRLIGASVLVLLGVVGFPLLFDTQPRPVSIDTAIEIPGKNTARALQAPGSTEKSKGTGSASAKAESSPARSPEPLAGAAPPASRKDARAEDKADARPEEPKAARKPAQTDAEGARAVALLNGAATAPVARPAIPETKGRTVVQIGAFADAAKADEVRLRLEKAGLKTYTQITETQAGKRIRVRVGPFASQAEADKAIGKIRSLDLPVAVVTL